MLLKVAQILAQPRPKKWQKRGEVGGGVVEQEGAGMAGASGARSKRGSKGCFSEAAFYGKNGGGANEKQ